MTQTLQDKGWARDPPGHDFSTVPFGWTWVGHPALNTLKTSVRHEQSVPVSLG